MIDGGRVLGVIPARGGSKRLPGKNQLDVGGKPLLAWTIEAARASRYLDRLILTTDDDALAAIARARGCEVPFMRPPELARDDTPGVAPVLHALRELPGYDWVVLLQPTSPLRSVDDIDGCLELCARRGAPASVSVTTPAKSPDWMYRVDGEAHMRPLRAPGATEPIYVLNGAVYACRTRWLLEHERFVTDETLAYVMPAERSLDVDDELDLLELRWRIQRQRA